MRVVIYGFILTCYMVQKRSALGLGTHNVISGARGVYVGINNDKFESLIRRD